MKMPGASCAFIARDPRRWLLCAAPEISDRWRVIAFPSRRRRPVVVPRRRLLPDADQGRRGISPGQEAVPGLPLRPPRHARPLPGVRVRRRVIPDAEATPGPRPRRALALAPRPPATSAGRNPPRPNHPRPGCSRVLAKARIRRGGPVSRTSRRTGIPPTPLSPAAGGRAVIRRFVPRRSDRRPLAEPLEPRTLLAAD